jgi:hypothetical protein
MRHNVLRGGVGQVCNRAHCSVRRSDTHYD